MSEAEFDRLLDAVMDAVAPVPAEPSTPDQLPVAANDNSKAWPLLPFPEGWGAAC